MSMKIKHLDLFFLVKNQLAKNDGMPGIMVQPPKTEKRLQKAYNSFLKSQEEAENIIIDINKNIVLTNKIKPYIYNIVNANTEIVRLKGGFTMASAPFSNTLFVSDKGATFVKIDLNEYILSNYNPDQLGEINKTFIDEFKVNYTTFSDSQSIVMSAGDGEKLLTDYSQNNIENLKAHASKANLSLDELTNLIKCVNTDKHTELINVYRHTAKKTNPDAITIKALLDYGILYKVIYKKSGDLLCIESVKNADEIFIKCTDFKEEN